MVDVVRAVLTSGEPTPWGPALVGWLIIAGWAVHLLFGGER